MLDAYREVWTADFEYTIDPDLRPLPVCLTAQELRSGRRVQLWRDEMGAAPPYPTDPGSIFVAYHASAETSCHLALGWPLPARILDLEAEYRCATTNSVCPLGKGLVGAMAAHGLDGMSVAEKKEMITLILRGGYSGTEKVAILEYCWADTDALADLLPRMLPAIEARPHGLEFALMRGEYSGHAVALMEHRGVPLDVPTLERLREHWDGIRARLVAQYDPNFGVYDGLSFRAALFADYLARHDIPWPVLESGALDLKGDTFKDMSLAYPQLEPLRQLRHTLGQLRVNDLRVGSDGRNRCMIGQFLANTGRNCPKASKYIFGPSRWLRSLIRPEKGRAVCYLDWEGQEFAIAAVLSNDQSMLDAVASGDPYMHFASSAKMAPHGALKADFPELRAICKTCCLGVLFGMGAASLAYRIKRTVNEAADLLDKHRQVYPTFWAWSHRAVREANLFGYIDTAMGWRLHDGPETRPTALMNAPMQSNAVGMMQTAACLAARAGVETDGVLHDAFLIEADDQDLEDAVATMRSAMNRASRAVLGGYEIGIETKVTRWPDHYRDGRKEADQMWLDVLDHLDAIEAEGRPTLNYVTTPPPEYVSTSRI